MNGALRYLLLNSWKNRLTMRVRRLKQPKYLVGAFAGAFYFLYVCGTRYFLVHHAYGRHGEMGQASPPDVVFRASVGAFILFALAVFAWVIPQDRAALVFTEAEVAFLFPAPVSRRTLIHFKLLKSQFAIFFAAALFTLIFGWSRGSGPTWTRAIGWWVILSTLNLHQLASSFARTMLLDRGISNWKRRFAVLSLAAALAGGVVLWAWHTLPPPLATEDATKVDNLKYYAEQVLHSGPFIYLLYPFRVVVQPYVSPDAQAFLLALGPALFLLGLHYVWVIRSNVAFEEASIEASQRMAEKLAAMRAGRHPGSTARKKSKRAPFQLRASGLPAFGFLWKNLIGAGSGFTLRTWLVFIWVAIALGFSMTASHRTASVAQIGGGIALMLLAMSFFMGPQLIRQDFRQDLPMADLLKTYPIPAWQMALGELMAPALVLTALQWCLLVLAFLLLHNSVFMGPEMRISAAIAVAVVAPTLNLLTLLIPNAAVLLFPSWFQTGRDAPQGIEATGQRLVFAIGQLMVLSLALLPAAAVFALLWFVARSVLGSPLLALPLAAMGAAVVLAAEGAAGLWLIGKLFERFDFSAESTSA